MCKMCQYNGCEKEATHKLVIGNMEVSLGTGTATGRWEGLFCEEHTEELAECDIDCVEELEKEENGFPELERTFQVHGSYARRDEGETGFKNCNDSLAEGDSLPDFDGCLGCSKYNDCNE